MRKRILGAIVLAAAATTVAFAGERQVIRPPGSKPGGNFSPGILVDGTLYVSGQIGAGADGTIPAEFEAEVQQTLDNIGAVLKAAGMSPADVVSVQVYLTDGETFPRMNAVYAKYFEDPRPARTTVVVAKLAGQARIEITVTARK